MFFIDITFGTNAENGLQRDEIILLKEIVLVGATFSFFGCLFILISYSLLKSLRDFTLRLVFFLTLSDFGMTLGWYMGMFFDPADPFVCKLQATSLQFFGLSSVLWTACVAHTLNKVISDPHSHQSAAAYHIISWGVPTVFALICLLAGVFGEAEMWCWITEENGYFRIFCYFLPAIICFFYSLTLYVWTIGHMAQRKETKTPLLGPKLGNLCVNREEVTVPIPVQENGHKFGDSHLRLGTANSDLRSNSMVLDDLSSSDEEESFERQRRDSDYGYATYYGAIDFSPAERHIKASRNKHQHGKKEKQVEVTEKNSNITEKVVGIGAETIHTSHSHSDRVDIIVFRRISLYVLVRCFPIQNPPVYLLTWLPSITNRAQNFLNPLHPWFFLYVVQAICSPLQGFLNALVYGFSPQFRRTISPFFARFLCCRSAHAVTTPKTDNPSSKENEEEAAMSFYFNQNVHDDSGARGLYYCPAVAKGSDMEPFVFMANERDRRERLEEKEEKERFEGSGSEGGTGRYGLDEELASVISAASQTARNYLREQAKAVDED